MSKYTKYFSKWKSMPVWSRIHHMKEYGWLGDEALYSSMSYQLDFQRKQTEDYLMGERGQMIKVKKAKKEWEKYSKFVNQLLKKYPELKYIQVNNIFFNDEDKAN